MGQAAGGYFEAGAAGMAAWRQTLSRWAGRPWPAPLSHLPFLLFTAALLAYGGGFAALILSNFDLLDLTVTTRDDAFYYFQIAWNMAQGRFSTFDGGITQTNGYHPLWLLLITPFYWFFDKESALFAIRVLEIMLIAGGVAVIALAARLCRLPWLLLFAALPLLYRHPALFFGMEAAAALFMLALLFLGLALFIGNPGRWKWGLAAVCFVLPWVRLEYIAISLAVAAVLCLFEFPQWRRTPGGWLDWLRSYNALVPLAGAGVGILVYFAYNGLVFGGIVPVSGATKALWSQFRWEQEGGYSFTENLAATWQLPAFGGELLAALALGLWLLPLGWLARRPAQDADNGRDRRLFAFMLGGFGLAVGHLAMFGYSVLYMHPEFQSQFQWYFVPAYLLMALLVPLHCYAALGLLRRLAAPRWPRAAKPLQAAVLLAGGGLLLMQADYFAYPRQSVNPPLTNSRETAPDLDRYAGTLMANRGLPDGSVIGSWASGIIGYFSRFPVVNLDGLVNSYDYLRATEPGAAPARWLVHSGAPPPIGRELGLTHLANTGFPPWEEVIFHSQWYSAYGEIASRFRIRALEEDAAAAAAGFARRVGEAAGPPAGRAWLLDDGRLTQAFAPACAPEELLVWSYADGAGGPAKRPDTIIYRSSAGWCAAAQIRPHGAPPPVGVETRPAGDYLAQLRREGPPEIEAPFEVFYLDGPPGTVPQLLYAREECGPADIEPWFLVHIIPVNPADLPPERQAYGFDNADFRFQRPGARFGDVCLAAVPLHHDYPISRIRTGQWRPEENRRLWESEFSPVP